MFLGEKSEAFRITKNNMVALINNERLAKIWNPGNVKLQIRNCKLKNLMLKGSKITASPSRFSRLKINRRLEDDQPVIRHIKVLRWQESLIWKIFDYFSLHVDYE